MDKMFKTQVNREHYTQGYDDLNRFISYFYQIDSIRKLGIKQILEVGVGNKTLSNYLKQHEFEVITCDYDYSLNPEYIADVRKLPFEDDSFDGVVAFEVLEHLPFKDFSIALGELRRVSRKKAIISLPYSSIYLELLVRFPFIDKLLKKNFLRLFFSFPFYSQKFLNKEHYWELGRKGYTFKIVRNVVKKHFKIVKEFRPPIDTYHYFFVLEKK